MFIIHTVQISHHTLLFIDSIAIYLVKLWSNADENPLCFINDRIFFICKH